MNVVRKLKVVTQQRNIDKPPQMEGYPMKEWSIELYLEDDEGRRQPAKCFTKVVYTLHSSFEQPIQTFETPPFRCQNEGWGEFDVVIDCHAAVKGGKITFHHDLNFEKEVYEVTKSITFKNPSQALQQILRETGPINDPKPRKTTDGKRKKGVDVEKMADVLPSLKEDQLLKIIELIHNNKSEEIWMKMDIDNGEFSVDLYTLPDPLAKSIWDQLLQFNVVN